MSKSGRYVWSVEILDVVSINADEIGEGALLFEAQYKGEQIEAAAGVLIGRMGLYMSEIQIEDAWFFPLRGRTNISISSFDGYFLYILLEGSSSQI